MHAIKDVNELFDLELVPPVRMLEFHHSLFSPIEEDKFVEKFVRFLSISRWFIADIMMVGVDIHFRLVDPRYHGYEREKELLMLMTDPDLRSQEETFCGRDVCLRIVREHLQSDRTYQCIECYSFFSACPETDEETDYLQSRCSRCNNLGMAVEFAGDSFLAREKEEIVREAEKILESTNVRKGEE